MQLRPDLNFQFSCHSCSGPACSLFSFVMYTCPFVSRLLLKIKCSRFIYNDVSTVTSSLLAITSCSIYAYVYFYCMQVCICINYYSSPTSIFVYTTICTSMLGFYSGNIYFTSFFQYVSRKKESSHYTIPNIANFKTIS